MALTRALAVGLLMSLMTAPVIAAPPPKHDMPRKLDLGDTVAGTYFGSVISDSKGSGRSDVTVTVTRTGVNEIAVTSDYARLPVITVKISRAMDKIVSATGDSNFLYDPAKSPTHLDISFHNEVSWSGDRQ